MVKQSPSGELGHFHIEVKYQLPYMVVLLYMAIWKFPNWDINNKTHKNEEKQRNTKQKG